MSGNEIGVGVQESIAGRGDSPCKGPVVEGKGYSWSKVRKDELHTHTGTLFLAVSAEESVR